MDILNDKVVLYTGAVLLAVFGISMLIEFVLNLLLRKNYFSAEYLVINLCIASLQQLTDVFNKLIFLGAFYWVQTHWAIQHWLGWEPVKLVNPFYPHINWLAIGTYVMVLVIADFCQYWLHRLSHEVNIMWAGHITHHSNTEYNFGVAVRQNALEGLYTWVFFMPLAFFGIPWQMFVAAYTVSLIWQFWVHTRFVNKLGWLESFMSTPSHHRVHHGKNPQYIDKNYGAFFIIWDKMFGTFEPEVEEVQYGILKPLENNNPIWGNVHHHLHIFKTAKAAQRWGERVKVFFGRPAFVPGSLATQAVVTSTNKASFTMQPEKKLYVFINFLLTSIAGFFALNYYSEHGNIWVYLAAAVFMLGCFSLFTALLENKKWADRVEVLRLILIATAGIMILPQPQFFNYGLGIIGLSALLLLFTWLVAVQYKRRMAVG